MIGKILGTGSAVPVRRVTNDELSTMVETNDEWIRSRTGIGCSHIISGEESTVSLSIDAAKNALDMAKVRPEEIDAILVATISSNVILPCTACEVQNALGCVNAFCYDLSAACSGFVFAYNTAQAYIQTGMIRTALVIGADCLTSLTNFEDRSSCILFGDAAGAAVVQATEEDLPYGFAMHSDGGKGWAMTCKSRHQEKQPAWEETFMQMNGKEIFKFASTRVPQILHEILEQKGLQPEEIDHYILHQANGRIIEAIARKMKLPLEKFPMNVEEYANSSSGTVPLLMDQMNRDGRLKKGDKVILCGYGAGVSWGAAYLEWPM